MEYIYLHQLIETNSASMCTASAQVEEDAATTDDYNYHHNPPCRSGPA